jgi:hypothetical protein
VDILKWITQEDGGGGNDLLAVDVVTINFIPHLNAWVNGDGNNGSIHYSRWQIN